MSFREVLTNAVAALRGKSLVYGIANSETLTLLPPRAKARQTAQAHMDPILMMDAHRDADRRLQEKFAAIHEEERNILDKLIVMD
jgi:hypothetical protein